MTNPEPTAQHAPQPTATPATLSLQSRNQAIAQAYDTVPYQSKPFEQSTPEQLAVMATLFGLTPPDFRKARILELGCSAGGNIIPLAAQYPQLKAVGIDISAVEIAHGQEVLQRAGIHNCELKALDIVHAQDQIEGQFDYIICHGVFSWVPQPVRDAILAVIRDRLSPNGVAYVSYNVYPGWKTREVIREMMMFHSSGRSSPAERIQQARAIVEYTKNISGEQTTYGKLLRDEAAQLARSHDHYLFHEFLELDNNPMYFRDFVGLAAAHQLAYLGEDGLADMAPQRLGQEIHQTLTMLSEGNILATEQYMDFFTNRSFRQTLLVHESQAAQVNRNLAPQTLRDFAVSTHLVADSDFKPVAGQLPLAKFKDAYERSLSVNNEFTLALINLIVQAKPGSIAVKRLVTQLKAAVPSLAIHSDEDVANTVGLELMNLLVQSVVKLGLQERLPQAIAAQPVVLGLARAQAQLGQDWVTNVLHQPMSISPAHREMIKLMDGTHSHAALQTQLLQCLKDGRLNAHRGQERITDEAELHTLTTQFYKQIVLDLRQMMLLQT